MCDSFVESCTNLSDDVLVSQINAGRYEALSVLIYRYLPIIRSYAHRYSASGSDTDDLEQEGLLALSSAVKAYRVGEASFSTFASLCIRRAMSTAQRATGRKRRIPAELVTSLDSGADIADPNSPEEIFFEREHLKSLTDIIRLELSVREYNVLLAFLSGKSYADIAEELNLSVKSVDNSLMRIRRKLKKKNGAV